jgi:hypothetical protein
MDNEMNSTTVNKAKLVSNLLYLSKALEPLVILTTRLPFSDTLIPKWGVSKRIF